jgi:hypothetical protein
MLHDTEVMELREMAEEDIELLNQVQQTKGVLITLMHVFKF